MLSGWLGKEPVKQTPCPPPAGGVAIFDHLRRPTGGWGAKRGGFCHFWHFLAVWPGGRPFRPCGRMVLPHGRTAQPQGKLTRPRGWPTWPHGRMTW